MSGATYWFVGLLLPLFPLSMAFNVVFDRVRNPLLRSLLLLVWPQLGVSIVLAVDRPVPHGIVLLALLTSVLYAFRTIALREVGQWTGYLATSGWALLWVGILQHTSVDLIRLYAFGVSAPLVLLTLLSARLEEHFGAAYTGLYGGLAQAVPRTAGVLVCIVLAAVAAPLSPSFFAMLATVMTITPTVPAAAFVITLVWLLWSWAGVRLLQGLIVGPAEAHPAQDLALLSAWAYAVALIALLGTGLYLAGGAL